MEGSKEDFVNKMRLLAEVCLGLADFVEQDDRWSTKEVA